MTKYTCYTIHKKGDGSFHESSLGKELMEKRLEELNKQGDGEYYIDWNSWETSEEDEQWCNEVGEIAEQGINSYKDMEDDRKDKKKKIIDIIDDIANRDAYIYSHEIEEVAEKILEIAE